MNEGIKSARNLLAVYKAAHDTCAKFEDANKDSLSMSYVRQMNLNEEERAQSKVIEDEYIRYAYKKDAIAQVILAMNKVPEEEIKAMLQSMLDCFD